MSLTSDELSVQVDGHPVMVTGTSGLVHATWTLRIDGQDDRAEAAGDFTLKGEMPDGTLLRAAVHQSLLGPAEVSIDHDGEEVARLKGFVA